MYRLQSGTDEDCLLFRKIAEQGHFGGRPGHSRQGTYAATPGGLLLASLNSNDPARVAEMLDRARERWDALPRAERLLDADPEGLFAGLRRAERFYPEDGLVLHVYSRDLPRSSDADEEPSRSWNQDYAWFMKAEARRFLPDAPRVGQYHDLPTALVSRLVRCHLVDYVRGETWPWDEKDIETARLTCHVTGVADGVVSLRLEGESRTSAEGAWSVRGAADSTPTLQARGFDARLEGSARYDLTREIFTAFHAVAVGTRWGGTRYNVRHDDPGPAPMGVAFTLAGRGPSERVAPAFFSAYDWEAGTTAASPSSR